MKFSAAFLLLLSLTPHILFAAPKQLTGQHAPANSPALSPEEAQKKFVLHDGFEARLFAAEPDIVNPVAMTFDDRGRLWVVELYEYPLGAPEGAKPRDRIKILEDTDNDGRADKVTIFADGLNLATAILYGDGGVYVGQAPELLHLKDTDGDDVADKREVLLNGFGLHDRHELLNGFTWGPDGQLYMTHGVFTSSKVKIPEATDDGIVMNAAVARFHPRTKKFEIYADGTSNPWGVDFDKYGNAFVSACVIDHLFHMAPGGIYVRQGGVPGNPYAYELLPSIVDHKHHMAAYCGINIYQGDNFPAEYQGRVFFGNIHQNAINHDRLIPNGSSFKAVAEKDFLTTSDGWFRPTVQTVGPDGALWIADWYDKYPCYQNAQADPEGVDRERGRIWRVVYTGKNVGKMGLRPDAKMDLAKMKSKELVKTLDHSNVWHRRSAQRLLIERRDGNVGFKEGTGAVYTGDTNIPAMLVDLAISKGPTLDARLAALWTYYATDIPRYLAPEHKLLRDSEPSIRAAAARAHVVDYFLKKFAQAEKTAASYIKNPNIPEAIADKDKNIEIARSLRASLGSLFEMQFGKLAEDPDPSVRLAVATACRQLVSSSLTVNTDINTDAPVEKVLATLIKFSADAKDPLIPFMIWMASEPLVAANPKPGLQWLAENGADNMPLSGILARKAMRRICDTGEAEKMDVAVEFLQNVWGKNDELTLAALDGLIEGQKAKPVRPTIDTQPHLAKAAENASEKIKERLQQLGTIWGDAAASEKTLALISDSAASLEDRLRAVQTAKQLKNDSARDALLKVIVSENPETLVVEAFRSLSAIGGDEAGSEIIKNWKKLSPNTRRAAADMLVARSQWVRQLLDALDDKTILPSELSATVARALLTSKNTNFAARAERLFGKFRETSADKLKLIAEKRKAVLAGEPNLKRGHELAKASCFVCHKLYDEGAEVGPDLTGVGRSTLDALLANVIDPNQIIGQGYENVLVETKDDRSVSGRMIENSDSHVKLLAAGPKEEVVAKSDIASMRVSELSVMPEGLEQMPDEDFRDMIWFILSPPQEGPLTPAKRNALIGK